MSSLPDIVIRAIAEEKYSSDEYDTTDQKIFALLVDTAAALLLEYKKASAPNVDDPESFKSPMLFGVNQGWGMIQGLIENLEMKFPDDNFRTFS